ncbi:GNAT family N-acetyltransferase [Bacillus songklensis]|uniref:GNAT family N-acetyltransferase n=1 Tax=Bacillus songklensis TaxID=1069116 RepID=A0ABV8B6Z2_9BACI
MNRIFERFPALETERLRLQQITNEHVFDLFTYFSRDDLTKYYDIDTFYTMEQSFSLVHFFKRRFRSREGIRWGLINKETNRLIGTCGFHRIEKINRKAELGYDLSPDYWQQGFMTEAARRIVEFGFNDMGLHRIEAYYFEDNLASRQLLLKLGFQREGNLKGRFFKHGEFVDAVVAALLKPEYDKMQENTFEPTIQKRRGV